MENNIYYVYEWIRLDTNEPFYVGKGKDDRCYKLTRGNNQHFNNIVKSIPVAVNILHDNLDEQTAFDLEVWYIREYRDIIGYDLTNMNDGGEGQTLCGKANGMYDIHRYKEESPMYGKSHSEKTKDEISKKAKERFKNKENHPLYGKNHSEESKKKMSKAKIGKYKGENHPQYGKGYLKKGKKNPNAKSIICLTTKKIFYTAKEAGEYYNISDSGISMCCKGYRIQKDKKIKVKSAGKHNGQKLVWKYLTYKHNKILRPIDGRFKRVS